MTDSSRVEFLGQAVRAAWAAGTEPDLRRLMAEVDPADERARSRVLVTDAECRAERDLPATLGHYLALFPSLAPGQQAVQELLGVEVSGATDPSAVTPEVLLGRYGERFANDIAMVHEVLGELLAPAGPRRSEPTSGQRLGKYNLRRLLGRGSFGQVWLAWDEELKCYVALKLILPAGDVARRASSLMVEAQAASSLNHPNVVGVRAAGRFPPPDDWLFIDMQVCGDPAPTSDEPKAIAVGESLPEYVKSHRLSPRDIARLMADIARGVVAAHAQGVVHCDLKPANVLVTPSGRAMVADFGLSASNFIPATDITQISANATVSVALKTLDGQMIRGSPAYMSPEQARGEKPKPISDVYGLGAILFCMLSGNDPYVSKPGQTLKQLLVCIGDPAQPNPPLRADTHPTLARICRQAMAKNPAERYPSASAMQADLEAFLEHRVPATVGPDSALQPLRLWTGRNAVPVGIAAAAVLGLATLSAVAMKQRNDARVERDATNELLTFVNTGMLAAVGVDGAFGRIPVPKERIDEAAASLSLRFRDRPSIRLRLQDTFAQAYLAAGAPGPAVDLLRESLADSADTGPGSEARSRTLGTALFRLRRAEEAIAVLERAEARRATQPVAAGTTDEVLVELRDALAGAYKWAKRFDDSRAMYGRVRDALASNPIETGRLLGVDYDLVLLEVSETKALHSQKKLDNAQRTSLLEASRTKMTQLVRSSSDSLGPTHDLVLRAGFENAAILGDLGRYQEAIQEAEPYVGEMVERLGPRHWRTLEARSKLGSWYVLVDKADQALPLLMRAFDGYSAVAGDISEDTLKTGIVLARAIKLQIGPDAAIAWCEELLARARNASASDAHSHENGAENLRNVIKWSATLCELWGRPEAAAQFRNIDPDTSAPNPVPPTTRPATGTHPAPGKG